MKQTVLLLTGTVRSSGVVFMKRDNYIVRLQDYTNALSKWVKNDRISIVFVENSNFPRESLGKNIIKSKNFEYLTYDGQSYSKRKGKGYGEINSFEYAFINSEIIKQADYIIKCNGRYYVKDILRLISFLDKSDVDVIGNFTRNLDFMDSRFFAFKPSFFVNYFIKYKQQINDLEGHYFEHSLAKATHELLSQGGKWCSIPIPLIIEGVSGTGNYRYDSLISKIKIIIKFNLKRILC